MGAPHRDRERKNEVVVFSGPGVEGQMPGRGEFNTETLQFADQGLGFRQLLLDFQPAFVQQGLQPRNERQLRHAADRTVTRAPSTYSAFP